jgi:peptidyl-prolyl cis-trans isomerase SurA
MVSRTTRVAASLLGAAAFAATCAFSGDAGAVVVEKIVAVVGDRAILLTELHTRARPFLTQLNARCPIGTPQCIPAENKIYQQTLDRMVDEELEELAAKRSNVTVSATDVTLTIERLAKLNNIAVSQLLADVTRQSGMSEAEYRQELRQQVLESKLLQRIAQSQIRITRQDLEEMYRRMVERERQILLYQPSWLVLQLGPAPSPELLAARTKEASELVKRAREEADFAELVRRYSDDSATRDAGGELGIRAPGGSPAAQSGQQRPLAEALEKVALGLGIGDVSEPFRFKDALVVMKVTNRQPSRYTSFEAAQAEMGQRVQTEKLEKAKQQWLKDLRRRTHVDVRFL